MQAVDKISENIKKDSIMRFYILGLCVCYCVGAWIIFQMLSKMGYSLWFVLPVALFGGIPVGIPIGGIPTGFLLLVFLLIRNAIRWLTFLGKSP
jgi:hypothetical protein